MKKLLLVTSLAIGSLFANDIVYKVDGKDFESYYKSPSKNAPLVFMVHDWDGINDYEKKRVDMLNKLGYAVFAVDLYGKGIRPTEFKDKKAMATSLYQDREKMRKLLYAGLDEAKKLGANVSNAIGTGYCFGGSSILEFARSGAPLKAFIPFHGNLYTPEGQDYKNTKGKIVVFHGSADKVVPFTEFAALATELESTGINHEMITYSGAPHAFTVFGSDRYRKDADEKSWKRFTQILNETF